MRKAKQLLNYTELLLGMLFSKDIMIQLPCVCFVWMLKTWLIEITTDIFYDNKIIWRTLMLTDLFTCG